MRQEVAKIGLLALAGCAVAATAACTSDATTPVAAPPPPSASSGAGAAASQRVGTPASPTVSPSVRPVKTIKPVEPAAEPTSTGQGGQGDIDWKRVAFRELGCKPQSDVPKRAAVTEIGHADLTGDGRRETLVTASCPTTTSTNAVHVFVFAADAGEKPLLDIGEGQYLRTVDVETKGRTVSIDAEAISDKASLCCPDLHVWQSWKWNGSAFVTRGQQTEEIS